MRKIEEKVHLSWLEKGFPKYPLFLKSLQLSNFKVKV